MFKNLKSPLFLLKLADAFILRLPLALLTVAAVFVLICGEGVTESPENVLLIKQCIVGFALIHALLFVIIFPNRTASQKSAARVGETLVTLSILALIFGPALHSGEIISVGFAEYFKTNVLPEKFYIYSLMWIGYMIISEIIKGNADKIRYKKSRSLKNETYQTFSEISCVYSALMHLDSKQDKKHFDELMRSSDELLRKVDKKRENYSRNHGGSQNNQNRNNNRNSNQNTNNRNNKNHNSNQYNKNRNNNQNNQNNQNRGNQNNNRNNRNQTNNSATPNQNMEVRR